MKKSLYLIIGILITMPAFPAHTAQQNLPARALVGTAKTFNGKSSLKWDQANFNGTVPGVVSASGANEEPVTPTNRDMRDAERTACLSNNLGADATFVWASRDSDPTNYATMVEDTQNPENNVCFARVEIQSTDIAVNLSDFQSKYFPLGDTVTCGDWVSHDDLEKRILDAKKTTRTLATIGGAVGGAGIGVGAMELGGNKLLAKAKGLEGLQGQKALSEDELFVSQLKDIKNNNTDQYNRIVEQLTQLKQECNEHPDVKECKLIDYNTILEKLK